MNPRLLFILGSCKWSNPSLYPARLTLEKSAIDVTAHFRSCEWTHNTHIINVFQRFDSISPLTKEMNSRIGAFVSITDAWDIIVVVLSHGILLNGELCFPMPDAQRETETVECLRVSALIELFRRFRRGRVFFIIDSCFSGAAQTDPAISAGLSYLIATPEMTNICVLSSAKPHHMADAIGPGNERTLFVEALFSAITSLRDAKGHCLVSLDEIAHTVNLFYRKQGSEGHFADVFPRYNDTMVTHRVFPVCAPTRRVYGVGFFS